MTASQAGHVQLTHAQHVPQLETLPIRLLAQDIQDPANVGGLFRLADALGVRHLYLAGATVTPPNAKLRRAARATEQYVPWTYAADPLVLVRTLKQQGLCVLSLEITSASVNIRDALIPQGREILLVLGAESAGVRQDLLDESAQALHIPMRGSNSSMNVTTACALAVFELSRHFPST